MKLKKIDVSVIIPCYNCSKTIERAVLSILEQSCLPNEIILVDDASTDISTKILEKIKLLYTSIPIKILLLEKNQGPSNARNKGWELSSSSYLAFLDSDDTWHPRKLEIQYKTMINEPKVMISGHLSDWTQDNPDFSNNPKVPSVQIVSKKDILLSNVFKTTSTIMIKKDIASRFPQDQRYAEDYAFILNLILKQGKGILIKSVLTYQYKAPYGMGGLSKNLWLMEKGELISYKKLWRNNLISSPTLLFLYVYSLLKYIRRWLITKSRI